jgi:hypothetical protein
MTSGGANKTLAFIHSVGNSFFISAFKHDTPAGDPVRNNDQERATCSRKDGRRVALPARIAATTSASLYRVFGPRFAATGRTQTARRRGSVDPRTESQGRNPRVLHARTQAPGLGWTSRTARSELRELPDRALRIGHVT